MTTTITTVLLLATLALAIETTIVNDQNLSDTVSTTSEPGGGQATPPQ